MCTTCVCKVLYMCAWTLNETHVLNKKKADLYRWYAKTLTAHDTFQPNTRPHQLCTMYVYAPTSDVKKLTVKCTTHDTTRRVVWGSSALLTVGAFSRRSYSYCWLDCGGPTSNSHNSHNIKSSTFNDSPLLFHIWMESPQFFKLLLKWGWINGSCLEPRPEGRVKGIPPVWRHWQPQRNHPKSLTGTHNPPLVQDLLTMFLECIWPYYSIRY